MLKIWHIPPKIEKIKNIDIPHRPKVKDKDKIEKVINFVKVNGVEILGVVEDAQKAATNIYLRVHYKEIKQL